MDSVKAFEEALANRDHDAAEALVQANPTLATERPASGMPPLLLAIYARAGNVVEALRAAGDEPTMGEAAALGDEATVRARHAADPQAIHEAGPDGFTPLHLAAHFNRAAATTLLLNLGADIHARSTNPMANTPLHAAAAGAAADAARVLLAAGADPDAVAPPGYRPIHIAAGTGAVEVVRMLLAKGADAGARTDAGETAADVARARDQDAVVALLESVG